MAITVAGRQVGDSFPCFITFEAGPTHNGLDSAIALVKEAALAGADAIKFQIVDADRLVSDKEQTFSYGVLVDRKSGQTETIEEPLYQILKRRELSYSDWRKVRDAAAEANIAFFATVSFVEDVDLLQSIRADSVKIASSDINHLPLIRAAARSGLCVQLDTGNATLAEVEIAVDNILAEDNDKIIVHQCPSGYPAHIPSIQLRMIQTLKQIFPFPIAFSDHSPGWEMDIAAVALGANMVEKTITMDRCTRSVEHMFSLEGQELRSFIQSIRDLEVALGERRRSFSKEQNQSRVATRRSVFLSKEKRRGEVVEVGDLDFRRPGFGIAPNEVDRIVGRRAVRELKAGTMLIWDDLV